MEASLTHEDMLRICGKSVAFVLAPNAEAAPHIADAVLAARKSEVAAIFILADLSCTEAAVDAVRTLHRKGRTMIQATELDLAATYGDAVDAADFHLEELPLSMIQVMRALAESVLDVYEAALVIDATQEAPDPEQLYDLCSKLRASKEPGEAFLHQDAHPSPYILSRAYLDEIEMPV